MATVKVKFRPSSVEGHEGTVFYLITHMRVQRQLRSGHRLFAEEWDEKRGIVRIEPASARHKALLDIRQGIRRDMERLQGIIRKLDDTGISYTSENIIDEFTNYTREYTLFNFMENVISSLVREGRIGTSANYRHTLNSFKSFRDNQDIMLDSITSDLMKDYEVWQRAKGVTLNSSSFYLRILRAVYNRAVDRDIITDRTPFRRVYTGICKTAKRALPLHVIRRIKSADLSEWRDLDYARDIFMMSFYLRGMSFVDMSYLRKSDLRNGYVTYQRRKTNQRLTIAWTHEMQDILDKYPENNSDYLLPIIKNRGVNERCAYRNAEYYVNQRLKKVAAKLGITVSLTLYVARHSWASAAKAKGIPLSIISEGLGHDSEATTRIYLASLDTAAVDQANSLILADL